MKDLVQVADKEREKFYAKIGRIADNRLDRLAIDFRRAFPKRRLEMLFGMGLESISVEDWLVVVDGGGEGNSIGMYQIGTARGTWRHDTPLANLLNEAIQDVWDITKGYADGCPNGLIVEPK